MCTGRGRVGAGVYRQGRPPPHLVRAFVRRGKGLPRTFCESCTARSGGPCKWKVPVVPVGAPSVYTLVSVLAGPARAPRAPWDREQEGDVVRELLKYCSDTAYGKRGPHGGTLGAVPRGAGPRSHWDLETSRGCDRCHPLTPTALRRGPGRPCGEFGLGGSGTASPWVQGRGVGEREQSCTCGGTEGTQTLAPCSH